MGNKLCKKRAENADNNAKPPTALNRIINKFSLKSKWKSDPNLDDKQINSYQVNAKNEKNEQPVRPPRPLSKSSDWTDIPLGPQEEKLNNKNLFNDNAAPIPPPRKKKATLKITLESLTSAFQKKQPVVEELFVKKTIDYRCTCCERGIHRPEKVQNNSISSIKESKKRKTPSLASLPNYNDFKFAVGGESNIDTVDGDKHSSAQSLPDETKKIQSKPPSDKADNYLTRARSFGSLLPNMLLNRMTTAKAPLAEIESDDSLGGLDDWGGLNMIEHYKPKDSSLPRPRRMDRTYDDMIKDIENQIDIEEVILEKEKNENNLAALPKTTEIQSPAVEHSSLLKILEKYGDQKSEPVKWDRPIEDFLNAERSFVDCSNRGIAT